MNDTQTQHFLYLMERIVNALDNLNIRMSNQDTELKEVLKMLNVVLRDHPLVKLDKV